MTSLVFPLIAILYSISSHVLSHQPNNKQPEPLSKQLSRQDEYYVKLEEILTPDDTPDYLQSAAYMQVQRIINTLSQLTTGLHAMVQQPAHQDPFMSCTEYNEKTVKENGIPSESSETMKLLEKYKTILDSMKKCIVEDIYKAKSTGIEQVQKKSKNATESETAQNATNNKGAVQSRKSRRKRESTNNKITAPEIVAGSGSKADKTGQDSKTGTEAKSAAHELVNTLINDMLDSKAPHIPNKSLARLLMDYELELLNLSHNAGNPMAEHQGVKRLNGIIDEAIRFFDENLAKMPEFISTLDPEKLTLMVKATTRRLEIFAKHLKVTAKLQVIPEKEFEDEFGTWSKLNDFGGSLLEKEHKELRPLVTTFPAVTKLENKSDPFMRSLIRKLREAHQQANAANPTPDNSFRQSLEGIGTGMERVHRMVEDVQLTALTQALVELQTAFVRFENKRKELDALEKTKPNIENHEKDNIVNEKQELFGTKMDVDPNPTVIYPRPDMSHIGGATIYNFAKIDINILRAVVLIVNIVTEGVPPHTEKVFNVNMALLKRLGPMGQRAMDDMNSLLTTHKVQGQQRPDLLAYVKALEDLMQASQQRHFSEFYHTKITHLNEYWKKEVNNASVEIRCWNEKVEDKINELSLLHAENKNKVENINRANQNANAYSTDMDLDP